MIASTIKAAETVEIYKNGKVVVRRGIVTATVDPREKGMERWTIVVRPPGRFKPKVGLVGYRVIYGPFTPPSPPDYKNGLRRSTKSIDEYDGMLLTGDTFIGKATTEDKLAMARKMLDWYFAQEAR